MTTELQAEKLSYSEVVITLDFESSIRSSNLRRRTFFAFCLQSTRTYQPISTFVVLVCTSKTQLTDRYPLLISCSGNCLLLGVRSYQVHTYFINLLCESIDHDRGGRSTSDRSSNSSSG